MIKKFIKACALIAGLFVFESAQAQQAQYNSIATAYVTTTISQFVVFDNTMKQGGTFAFSVLAHNGGGRAGQSDTANVKIDFYNSSNSIISTVNTTYSANLPNPNAVCGNPCIDPAVPWSTLSISSTLSSAQASNVAYAKVSMYGIDGSYWAGDYGPWYRAPTLTLNNGGNLLYNPEFGPYNGVNAQGWTASPGFGACQGAWGGSNACIVNSSGQPGTSTVGLVANQNGGGPSATGGTTSGQAGGYNSTMSTTNPNGAPAATTSTNAAGTTITTTLGQTTDGTITNAGTINTTGTNNGISATGSVVTSITNSGTITTDNGTGINAQQGTNTSGNITITNSGTITANTSGTTGNNGTSTAQGIMVSFNGTSSTGTATVTNTSTGTITTTNGDSVVMMGYGTNILNNNGSITTNTTGTNSMPAVLMNKSATINNNGSITGDVGVDFASATTPTINNNATGTITGASGLAIINLGTTTGTVIKNAGTITGAVQLPTNGAYTFLGAGSQVGAIRFNGTSGGDVYVGNNTTIATTTLQGNMGDPAATGAPAGTYGNFPAAFTFGSLNSVTVASGSTLTDNTGYAISASTVTNNGTFVSGLGTTTINGTFNNNGALTTTFNGPAYSQIAVNGAMNIGNSATYVPVIVGNTSTNVTLNSAYTNVISATGGISGSFVTTSGQVAGVNWAITANGSNGYDVTWTPSIYIVGTAPGNPVVTQTSTNGATTTTTTSTPGISSTVATITTGTPVVTSSTGFASSKAGSNISVTRTVTTVTSIPFSTLYTTTTPVTTVVTSTTPVTTVTNTTPTTVTTYSDGSTTTANGATTQTTNTANQVVNTSSTVNQVTTATLTGTQVTATPVNTTKTVSANGINDVFKASRTNPFVVDVLSTKDGSWAVPSVYRVSTTGHMTGKAISGGYQNTVDDNTVGMAFSVGNSDSGGLVNTRTNADTYSATIYMLNKFEYAWLKTSLGWSKNIVNSNTNIQDFGVSGMSKAKQTNIYSDVTVYSADTFWGFRPLAGVTVVRSQVSDAWNTNPLLPVAPNTGSTVQANPYAGLRWEYNKDVSVEGRVTRTRDFKTVAGVRATVKTDITDDISINLTVGADKGKNYNNLVGMIGLNARF